MGKPTKPKGVTIIKTLRQLLTEYREAGIWPTDDESLEDALRECFEEIWEGDDEEYRWRIEYDVVCKIDDNGSPRYFRYSACKGTNDNSWEDAGYIFEGIDNVCEVYPEETTVITYKTTK